MALSPDIIARWPGKSPAKDGGVAHPAVYHMLDVASVAEVLIAPFGFRFTLRDALVLLTALHDLGKIGNEFRAMLNAGRPQMQGRHWEVTEALLRYNDAFLARRLGGDDLVRFPLYAAVSGHHGGPPTKTGDQFTRMCKAAGGEALSDSAQVIESFCAIWPDASLAGTCDDEIRKLGWWIPGLVTAADWIASNTDWFPPTAPGPTLSEYLESRRPVAVRAVGEAGIGAAAPESGRLFNFREFRPMQSACRDIALPDGPILAVIEDETGAGKTEAALLLAQRMLAAGKGRGLFFALPTMATSDAMFGRLSGIVGRLFKSPSLALAHGRAGLSVEFREIVGREPTEGDEPSCARWLADDRRRALLANIGVGTVDQALLAVLKAKFSTLRLFGLSSKILIVDEVHEVGEPYMAEVLSRLLHAHAALGGSAILLTATLPLELRARLVGSFQKGRGIAAIDDRDPAYPALAIAGGERRSDLPRRTGPRGAVKVERLASTEDAVRLLADAARSGAACVWVRNAVDDAIAAFEALRGLGVPAHLLHARFALCDRKRIEKAVLERFGKSGEGRGGHVLVATQVVENSLDLDFDVMISDLAPMAALIQRAGRLWRHMDLRPARTRAAPSPVLHVLSPDPALVTDSRWLRRALDRGAYVYPLDLQWRTAAVLTEVGRIEAPGNLRNLVESVHGPQARAVPAVLEKAERDRVGRGQSEHSLAAQNVIDWENGYRAGAARADDRNYPTRLGEPQHVLALARWNEGRLMPWADDPSLIPGDRWQLSEVQAAERKFAGLPLPDPSAPEILAAKEDWPEWKRESVTLCPVADDGKICQGLRYDADTGLRFISGDDKQ